MHENSIIITNSEFDDMNSLKQDVNILCASHLSTPRLISRSSQTKTISRPILCDCLPKKLPCNEDKNNTEVIIHSITSKNQAEDVDNTQISREELLVEDQISKNQRKLRIINPKASDSNGQRWILSTKHNTSDDMSIR